MPYLNFAERISQVYLNKYTLALVLVTIKVYLFQKTLVAAVRNIPDFSDCSVDELPTKVSVMIRNMVENNLNSFTYSTLALLHVAAKSILNLIWFAVEMLLGTYTCLFKAAIVGTSDFAADTSEMVVKGLNTTIVEITHDIQLGLDGLSSILNKVVSTASKVADFFTGNNNLDSPDQYQKSISLSLGKLTNLSIPSSVLGEINKIRIDPDFSSVENSTKKLIEEPFTSLTNQWNQNETLSLGGVKFPLLQPLLVCDIGSKSIQELSHNLSTSVEMAAKIVIIILAICAVLVMVPLIYDEWRKWNREERIIGNLVNQNTHYYFDLREAFSNLLHPYLRFLPKSWLSTYVFSNYSISFLLVGLLGLFVVFLQYIILRILIKKAKGTDIDTSQMTKELLNMTSVYLSQIDSYFQKQEDNINDKLFGSVKLTSSKINSTLHEFMSTLNDTVNSIFSNTPFSGPVNTIVYCTIGRKIDKVESGLTWINDNLSVKIPNINKKQLLDNLKSVISESDLSAGSVFAKGVQKTIAMYKLNLFLEFVISISLVGVWVMQLLIGVIIAVTKSHLKRRRLGLLTLLLDKTRISSPKELTKEEKLQYGYGFSVTNPYEVQRYSSKLSGTKIYNT